MSLPQGVFGVLTIQNWFQLKEMYGMYGLWKVVLNPYAVFLIRGSMLFGSAIALLKAGKRVEKPYLAMAPSPAKTLPKPIVIKKQHF